MSQENIRTLSPSLVEPKGNNEDLRVLVGNLEHANKLSQIA